MVTPPLVALLGLGTSELMHAARAETNPALFAIRREPEMTIGLAYQLSRREQAVSDKLVHQTRVPDRLGLLLTKPHIPFILPPIST